MPDRCHKVLILAILVEAKRIIIYSRTSLFISGTEQLKQCDARNTLKYMVEGYCGADHHQYFPLDPICWMGYLNLP